MSSFASCEPTASGSAGGGGGVATVSAGGAGTSGADVADAVSVAGAAAVSEAGVPAEQAQSSAVSPAAVRVSIRIANLPRLACDSAGEHQDNCSRSIPATY